MKKLFGHTKQKTSKASLLPTEDTPQQQQQQLVQSPSPHPVRHTPPDEDRWEVVSTHEEPPMRSFYQATSPPSRNSSYASLPPGASPPVPSPNGPRSPSPFSIASVPTSKAQSQPPRSADRDPAQQNQLLRKKPPPNTPPALGILRALDPPRTDGPKPPPDEKPIVSGTYSDTSHKDREKDPPEKKDKWAFWKGDKDREKQRLLHDRGRDKDRLPAIGADGQNELTRMIAFLIATASVDWSLVLEVCERASANELNAKEAVRTLRREFKYGEPAAQLSAARLWAIMLRNSSELFVTQSTTRKFLDTLEDLLTSPRTSPVVRERVLDVVAAAAYASGSKRETGFRGLWRRVKPADKPDEGIPLDNDDAMLNPPLSSRHSHYDTPQVAYREASPVHIDHAVSTPTTPVPPPKTRHKSPTRNRIIPRDEDIRRLFQECKLGQGNAGLLSQALALSKPEDLKKKDVIKEFYTKCRASQELISAQIPWASSGAEQSRAAKDQEYIANGGIPGEEGPLEQTVEEKLLAALLAANTELMAALLQYDDLARVALERHAEHLSRKETRLGRRHVQQLDSDGSYGHSSDRYSARGSSSPSPSRSSSPPSSNYVHHHHHHLPPPPPHAHQHSEINTLAPPPPAPHGPRLPSQPTSHSYSRSRTPSPATPVFDGYSRGSTDTGGFDLPEGINSLQIRQGLHRRNSYDSYAQETEEPTPRKPSAKALGKRRVVEEEIPEQNPPEDDYHEDKNAFPPEDRPELEDVDDADGWHHQHHHRPPVQYVYDAVAERTMQRIRDGQAAQAQAQTNLVNGVH